MEIVKANISIKPTSCKGISFIKNKIPDSILSDPILNKNIEKLLPSNYNFEIFKTIWRIQSLKAQRIALQLPEGLALFSCVIADIIEKYFDQEKNRTLLKIDDILIMGDVTYGACCIDDYTAKALRIDLLIHYGHSCLVTSQIIDSFSCGQKLNVLYIFVDILYDINHLIETLKYNFDSNSHLYIGSTVQFISTLPKIIANLKDNFFNEGQGSIDYIDRVSPLSRGEVLGCTAPKISCLSSKSPNSSIIFIADGRFHLEALMIANQNFHGNFYLYNPYDKKLTHEKYDNESMLDERTSAIATGLQKLIAKLNKNPTEPFIIGLILSTLGRQGSTKILDTLEDKILVLNQTIKNMYSCANFIQYSIVLISEISQDKLAKFKNCDLWVQIGCPRLSIDWGNACFDIPFITPYEFIIFIKDIEYYMDSSKTEKINNNFFSNYPMDYYAYDSLGPWTPAHKPINNNKN